MMEVDIHRDIMDYKSKFLGGFTLQKLIAAAGAIVVTIITAWVLTKVAHMSLISASWLYLFSGLPIWFLGFYSPDNGLSSSRYVTLFWKNTAHSGHMPYQIDNHAAPYIKKEVHFELTEDQKRENALAREYLGDERR